MSHSAGQLLTALSQKSNTLNTLKLEGISEAPTSLKTRLLELGLIKGTLLKVSRNGGQFLIHLRGDTLLLRASEAQHLVVSAS